MDPSSNEMKTGMRLLHNSGFLLWFDEVTNSRTSSLTSKTILRDIVILDQAWLAHEFTNVVSHKFARKDGKVYRDHFDLVWKRYPKNLREKLLGLMERLQVIFPVAGMQLLDPHFHVYRILQLSLDNANEVGIKNLWLIPCMFSPVPSQVYIHESDKIEFGYSILRIERLYQFEFLSAGLDPADLFPLFRT
jgi:hypothetical protein